MNDEDKEFKDLLDQMWTIRQNKRADYNIEGETDPNWLDIENFQLSRLFGVSPPIGILIRMSDKITRVASFVRKGFCAVKDESVEDTLLDLANYSLLCLIEFRKLRK